MPKDRSIYSEPRMASTQKKQDFPVDKIMFLIEYNSMLRNREYVNKFTKEEQPEFGFTDDPVILQFEESNANAFKLILEDEFKDSDDLNTFNELIKITAELDNLFSIQAGLEYQQIYDAFEGEENREEKAIYLFGEGSFFNHKATFQSKVFDDILAIAHSGIARRINHMVHPTATTTLREVLSCLNLTEAEMEDMRKALGNAPLDRSMCEHMKEIYQKQGGELIKSDQDFLDDGINSIKLSYVKIKSRVYYKRTQADLDPEHKKLLDIYEKAASVDKNESDNIKAWVQEKGQKMAADLSKANTAKNMLSSIHSITCNEEFGINPSTERINSFLEEHKRESAFVQPYIKGELSINDALKKITNYADKRMKNTLMRTGTKDALYGYETYYAMHLGANAGATDAEKVENFCKIYAARVLEKNDREFDIKEIHKYAKTVKMTYQPELLSSEELTHALTDINNVFFAGKKLWDDSYKIKNDRYDAYVSDMKALRRTMKSDKKRSPEYKALVASVEKASKLDRIAANMTPAQKAQAFGLANLAIIQAIQKYAKGKEAVRTSTAGQDRFDNMLDALSIVSKYTNGSGEEMNPNLKPILQKINKKRGADERINPSQFEKKYGAARATKSYNKRHKIENKAEAPRILG